MCMYNIILPIAGVCENHEKSKEVIMMINIKNLYFYSVDRYFSGFFIIK